MRPPLLSLLLIAIAPIAPVAHAQATESPTTVSAIAGQARTWDDEGSLGRGWLAGVAADRTLFGATRIELSLEILTHRRDVGYFQANGRTLIGGLSLVRRFGREAVQPYLFAGVTAGHHVGWVQFEDRRSDVSNTDAGLRFGAGVAIRAGSRYEISPEVRMNGLFVDDDSDAATLLSVGIRFGIRM